MDSDIELARVVLVVMPIVHRLLNSSSELGRASRFAIVGGVLTILDYVVFRSLLWLTAAPSAARLVASAVSVTASYAFHRTWSFRSSQPIRETALAYFATRALAALIIQLIFRLCMGFGGFSAEAAFWTTAILYPVINYTFARRFVFKR